MKRWLFGFIWLGSLGLLAAICILWGRGRTGADAAALQYNRYLANGRAASDALYFTSDTKLWLTLQQGSVEPYNGQLVWGYHINADRSGGKPQFEYRRSKYATNVFSGDGAVPTNDHWMTAWGPLRWTEVRRSAGGEQYWSLTIGIPHWLAAALLL